jgi:hypothetical protein
MANIFDSLKERAFDTTAQVMGYDASWVPSSTPEAEPLTARVHFKKPDEKQDVSGVDFMPLTPFMEYRAPFFDGLYESVRATNGGEIVTINGVGYHVLKVARLHDGDTFKADLEPVTEDNTPEE